MNRLTYKHTIYASYLGYITQAIINNLAPLLFLIFQDSFSISLSKITFLITINFCIQLIIDFLSAKFVDKIGYRISIVAAHIFSAAGLIGMSVFPIHFNNAYTGLLISVAFYAVGGGLIEVLISPIVEACPTDDKTSAMSLLHSFYCWGTVLVIVLSTIFLTVFGKTNWALLPCLWSILPIANAVLFLRVPINTLTEDGQSMSVKELFSMKIFWIFMVLMITAGASEQAMSQWASAFAESGLGVSKTIGDLAGPCMFSILMGTSRALYAKFSSKLPLLPFLTGSGCLCIAAYLLAALSPSPIPALVGCGICGFSVGIMWPGVFSLASARCPRGGTALFAFLALAGDVGCSGGPTAVGIAAGAFSDNLKTGLLFAITFPVILILSTQILKNRTISV